MNVVGGLPGVSINSSTDSVRHSFEQIGEVPEAIRRTNVSIVDAVAIKNLQSNRELVENAKEETNEE